jgi:mannose-6-phosphate isomerase-like protein (cupin superfamily)
MKGLPRKRWPLFVVSLTQAKGLGHTLSGLFSRPAAVHHAAHHRSAATMAHRLDTQFIHLGPGATAVPQPEFTGGAWYEAYGMRHDHDGADGRLVSLFHFTQDWDSWEMHPHGDEVVLCISGRITLHQDHVDGSATTVTIGPGEYAINPPGCWHTADVDGPATALFITAGLGTETRAR